MENPLAGVTDTHSALQWIRRQAAALSTASKRLDRTLGKLLNDLLDADKSAKSKNINQIILDENSKLIETAASDAGSRWGQFSPIFYAMLRFDLPSLGQSGVSREAMQRNLARALLYSLDLPADYATVAKLKRYSNFDELRSEATRYPRVRSKPPVTEDTPSPRIPPSTNRQKLEPTPISTATAQDRDLLATLPHATDFGEMVDAVEKLQGEFKRQIIARLLPPLKEEMQRMPHESYEQKKEIVRFVNSNLRRLDLAVKSPKTGLPATFRPFPGNHPEVGSFQLRSEDADGREKTFTTPDLATLLDNFELVEAAPRREALSEWRDRVKQPHGGSQRG